MKVGEAGLATVAGAQLMPLETTEDAGTWRARKSALGLVGSSVGRSGKDGAPGRKEEEEEEDGLGVRRERSQ